MNISTGTSSCLPAGVLTNFAEYRHKVFVEKLRWELDCKAGLEYDQFDGPETLYLVAHSASGRVIGGARLLPTTGRYLLSEVFPEVMHGMPPPCSEDTWELSRFAAVDLDSECSTASQFSSPIAVGLLEAAIDAAARRGARRLITVSPLGVERLLRRAGFRAARVGPTVNVGGHHLFACLIEVDRRPLPTADAAVDHQVQSLTFSRTDGIILTERQS